MRVITLEEHFTTEGLVEAAAKFMPPDPGMKVVQEKLKDLGAGRLAAMDAGGVDVQVLSVAALGLEKLDVATATTLMREANDQLAAAVKAHPTRFAGFANVALGDPESAAREIERCVKELGFCGVMLNGMTGGGFLDEARFTPIWEAIAELGVTAYLHPAPPPEVVEQAYYSGLPGAMGRLLSIAGWGWHVETGLHVLRLIVSGLLDRYPKQQVVIGHMGEDLPYSLARAAGVLQGAAKHLQRPVAEYFHQNFHVTTSGYFTQPPFQCAMEVVGIDRLLYSVDYPFSGIEKGVEFLKGTGLGQEEMEKLVGGNAERLLGV